MSKPNVVFIMADQMSAKALPFYGHPVVKAPTLSRLAREGVLFERAYCNAPLCGPSRTSMMTGLLPSRAGAFDNAHEFPASLPTFAHYMRLGGYRTCLSGKMHFAGPDQLHGFEERLTTDIYPSDFSWTPNWAEPDAKVRFQDMRNVFETGPCLRSLQIDYDDDVGTQATRWLYDRARDAAPQPFMLTVSFTSPHDPYVARPEFWDHYRDDEIDLPRVPPQPRMDAHSRAFARPLFGRRGPGDRRRDPPDAPRLLRVDRVYRQQGRADPLRCSRRQGCRTTRSSSSPPTMAT